MLYVAVSVVSLLIPIGLVVALWRLLVRTGHGRGARSLVAIPLILVVLSLFGWAFTASNIPLVGSWLTYLTLLVLYLWLAFKRWPDRTNHF